MTALLAVPTAAGACSSGWPDALVLVALCALCAFILWLITR